MFSTRLLISVTLPKIRKISTYNLYKINQGKQKIYDFDDIINYDESSDKMLMLISLMVKIEEAFVLNPRIYNDDDFMNYVQETVSYINKDLNPEYITELKKLISDTKTKNVKEISNFNILKDGKFKRDELSYNLKIISHNCYIKRLEKNLLNICNF